MSSFEVLAPGGLWPSGDYRDVAVLPIVDADVARVFGAEMNHGIEVGLGPWRAVGFRLSAGAVAELIYYPSSPGPSGYALRLDRDASVQPALSEVLFLFGLQRDSLLWIAGGA